VNLWLAKHTESAPSCILFPKRGWQGPKIRDYGLGVAFEPLSPAAAY